MKENTNNIKITVVGAGMWGTTLAIVLGNKGYNIKLWVRSKAVYDDILSNNVNSKYTGNSIIPKTVKPFFGNNKDMLFKSSEAVIFAVPSHTLRGVIKFFFNKLSKNSKSIRAIVNATKGLEIETNKRLSVVMKRVYLKG